MKNEKVELALKYDASKAGLCSTVELLCESYINDAMYQLGILEFVLTTSPVLIENVMTMSLKDAFL